MTVGPSPTTAPSSQSPAASTTPGQREEVVQARLRWGETTVGRAGSVGLLEVPLLAAHCVWVHPDEIAALAGASRPLAADLVTRAGLERFSRLAVPSRRHTAPERPGTGSCPARPAR